MLVRYYLILSANLRNGSLPSEIDSISRDTYYYLSLEHETPRIISSIAEYTSLLLLIYFYLSSITTLRTSELGTNTIFSLMNLNLFALVAGMCLCIDISEYAVNRLVTSDKSCIGTTTMI